MDVVRTVNELALDAADAFRILTSPSDLKRIQRLDLEIRKSIDLAPAVDPAKIEINSNTAPANTNPARWELPSEKGAVEIQVDTKLLKRNKEVIKKEK